jgi:hypothetical protein
MGNTPSSFSPEELRIQELLNTETQSYETLPNNIMIHEYERLDERLKIYYDITNIKTRIIEDLGITIRFYSKRSQQEVNARLEDIQSRIRSTPGIEISYNEYNILPAQLKDDYRWEEQYPPGGRRVLDKPISYIRGMLWSEFQEEQRLAKERRLQDIRTQPGIVITQEEYFALSSEMKQNFEWIFESLGNTGGYGPSVGNFKKGRTAAQIQADKAARLLQIRTTPGIQITVPEYNELPADIKRDFEWLGYGPDSQYAEGIIHGYRKGRTSAQVQADIYTRYQVIRSTPEIILEQREYDSLPANLKQSFEWIRQTQTRRGETWTTGFKKGRSLGT